MRAMVIGQHQSGLPKDRFVNTFHFQTGPVSSKAENADQAATALNAFYTGVPAAGPALNTYLSGVAWASVEYRFYDLADPLPRVPEIREQEWAGGVTTGLLPEEVAVCLSYISPLAGPRGRGRIYLGPFGTGVLQVSGGRIQVLQALRTTVVDRATDLMNTTMNPEWCVYSRVNGAVEVVQGGYVDNAFDTQRRRGLAPTARDAFGTAIP